MFVFSLCCSFYFLFLLFFMFVCVFPPQLQEAKQLERDRHRQHSPVPQHSEPESPQLQTPVHPPAKTPTQQANGPVSPRTPSIAFPSTPSTLGPESSSRSVSGEQEEQEPVYENPDPENGSEFCVTEDEQTEADQATAATAAAQSTACFCTAVKSVAITH